MKPRLNNFKKSLLLFRCYKLLEQMKDVMFVIMLVALTNFITGSIIGPSSETEEARGFIGYSSNAHSITQYFPR